MTRQFLDNLPGTESAHSLTMNLQYDVVPGCSFYLIQKRQHRPIIMPRQHIKLQCIHPRLTTLTNAIHKAVSVRRVRNMVWIEIYLCHTKRCTTSSLKRAREWPLANRIPLRAKLIFDIQILSFMYCLHTKADLSIKW